MHTNPGSRHPSAYAPVSEHLIANPKKVIHRNNHRGIFKSAEVERHHARHGPVQRDKCPTAKARIFSRGQNGPIEQILPMGIKPLNACNDALGDASLPCIRTGDQQSHLPALKPTGITDGDGVGGRDIGLQQGQTAFKIDIDDPRQRFFALLQRDRQFLRPKHDITHRQNMAMLIDQRAGTSALRTQNTRRGVIALGNGVDVNGCRDELLQEFIVAVQCALLLSGNANVALFGWQYTQSRSLGIEPVSAGAARLETHRSSQSPTATPPPLCRPTKASSKSPTPLEPSRSRL